MRLADPEHCDHCAKDGSFIVLSASGNTVELEGDCRHCNAKLYATVPTTDMGAYEPSSEVSVL